VRAGPFPGPSPARGVRVLTTVLIRDAVAIGFARGEGKSRWACRVGREFSGSAIAGFEQRPVERLPVERDKYWVFGDPLSQGELINLLDLDPTMRDTINDNKRCSHKD
jgi:hypothetical protein